MAAEVRWLFGQWLPVGTCLGPGWEDGDSVCGYREDDGITVQAWEDFRQPFRSDALLPDGVTTGGGGAIPASGGATVVIPEVLETGGRPVEPGGVIELIDPARLIRSIREVQYADTAVAPGSAAAAMVEQPSKTMTLQRLLQPMVGGGGRGLPVTVARPGSVAQTTVRAAGLGALTEDQKRALTWGGIGVVGLGLAYWAMKGGGKPKRAPARRRVTITDAA